MPNYCACSLQVSFPERIINFHLNQCKEELTTFSSKFNTVACGKSFKLFSFSQDVPLNNSRLLKDKPKTLWGTNGDAHEPRLLTNTNSQIVLEFKTAWSPPLSWIKITARKYPHLQFTLAYCESGQGFYGVFKICAFGGITKSTSKDYEFLKDDLICYNQRDSNGNPIPLPEDDDDPAFIDPSGRLAQFLTKYKLSEIGG